MTIFSSLSSACSVVIPKGFSGLSSVPFLTLAIIALALPRMILSSQALTESMSPSRPLLTSTAIISSLERESNVLDSDLLSNSADGRGGLSAVPFLTLAIIALALPRMILSSHALTESMSPSRPLLTSSAISFSLSWVMPFFWLTAYLQVFVLRA